MFGSTGPCGQSSPSLFGQSLFRTTQQQGFGQATTSANNPFAPKQFGSPATTFGVQTGSSPFGNTSGPSRQQQSAPTFGTPSSSPFGSSTPAFGSSPTPAFGATSSTFGSGSLFGQQKSSFGSFGSSSSHSTPFGGSSTFQQTQPIFGSSTFGALATPHFGAATTPAFGTTTMPGFGATTKPAFSLTPTSLFGAASTPAFGSTAFGSSTPGFGNSGTASFGVSSIGFGVSSTPTFGQATATSFGSGSSLPVGQPTTSFGTSSFGGTPSPFSAQSSPVGSLSATSFGPTPFGNQAGGTRIKPYAQTPDADGVTSGPPAFKLHSISVMAEYKDKSHEELRWEDYQRGDKGGPSPSRTPAPQPNPFSQVNPSPQFPSPPSNPVAKILTGTSSTSAFTNTTMSGSGGSVFPTNSSPSLFSNTNAALVSSPLFGTSISPNQSPFSTAVSLSTQSVGLFSSSPAFVQLSSSTTGSSSSGSLFSTPTLFGSRSSPFSSIQSAPAQTSSVFSFLTTTQPALGGFTGISNTISQAPIGQLTPSQSDMVFRPAAPISHPFGTLPAMPQMSTGNAGSSPSIQYGISSLPVAEKPLSSRTVSMVVPRHLSQRRIKLHPRKYNQIADDKVPFFADDEGSPATGKADEFFIPRENPRNLIICPTDQRFSHSGIGRQSVPKDSSDPEKYKGVSADIVHDDKTTTSPSSRSPVENGNHLEPGAATQHGNNTSVEKLMPKLPRADYFMEPSLEELAIKERAEPGYCSRVRDFVVGRHGYGSIKFLEDIDVRDLDMESILEFNNREVIVYKDDSRKPPVGEGLNKAAEVTLLKVKCVNKKTGKQYHEGPRVDRYKEKLVKMAKEQGAEFVSFDPAKGEWKFRVKHFSAYGVR